MDTKKLVRMMMVCNATNGQHVVVWSGGIVVYYGLVVVVVVLGIKVMRGGPQCHYSAGRLSG